MRKLRDSGLPWLKEIPCNWKNETIRHLMVSRDGGAWGEEPKDESSGTICLRIADFDYSRGRFKKCSDEDLTRREYTKSQLSRLSLKAGDILVEKSGGGEKTPVGRSVYYGGEYGPVLFANFMERLRFDTTRIDPEYAEYWLRAWYACRCSSYYINQTTGIQNINLTLMLAKERIFYPSFSEQRKIIDYLDKRCGEIDALTADIQTQINTLEQYKRSVITETVTKGLNPNAEMKDSGIQWVGEIPVHWPVHPVYSYYGERKNKNRLGKEDNLLSLSYGRVIRKDINTNDGLLPESFNTYNIVEAGDIIIRPTDLQNDKRSLRTGLVKEHGIITSAYIDLCPLKQVDSRYFHFLLHAYDVMKVFYNMGNGVRQGLNYSEFSRLMVFEPPYEEQVAMADYLEIKVTEVDAIIEQKKEQMAVLDAYKRSLIFEYVTGKKEVPLS